METRTKKANKVQELEKRHEQATAIIVDHFKFYWEYRMSPLQKQIFDAVGTYGFPIRTQPISDRVYRGTIEKLTKSINDCVTMQFKVSEVWSAVDDLLDIAPQIIRNEGGFHIISYSPITGYIYPSGDCDIAISQHIIKFLEDEQFKH